MVSASGARRAPSSATAPRLSEAGAGNELAFGGVALAQICNRRDKKGESKLDMAAPPQLCGQSPAAHAVGVAVEEFMVRLDVACWPAPRDQSGVAGLYEARCDAASAVCATVLHGGSVAGVVQAVRSVRERHAQREVALHKRKLERHIDGAEMLAVCAASFHRTPEASKLEVISMKQDVIKEVCSEPTPAMVRALRAAGFSATVLGGLLRHSGSSTEKIVHLLTQYLSSHGVAQRLHDACVGAAAAMREDLNVNCLASSWSDAPSGAADVAVAPPHGFAHASPLRVRPAGALRVSSFLRALEQCAASGAFVVAFAGAPPKWEPPPENAVPPAYRRDYHMLVAFEAGIPREGGLLHPMSVADHAFVAAPFFEAEGFSRRSLEQVAAHVLRKCAYQLDEQLGAASGVRYVKNAGPYNSTGRLEMDAGGAARLRLFVRDLLGCMAGCRSEWRASRSSRKMAGRRA